MAMIMEMMEPMKHRCDSFTTFLTGFKAWAYAKSSMSKLQGRTLPVLDILLSLVLTLILLVMVFTRVDLKPKVDENFFFSSDDPQFKADKIISHFFPQPPQIIIGARGDIGAPEYAEKVKKLSEDLSTLSEVFGIQSLSHGPDDIEDALESPLWKRVLVSEDGKASFVSVFIKNVPPEMIIPKIEEIRNRHNGPGFQLMISGPPYIIEVIRRNLLRDLQIFTLAAFVVFSAALLLIFHSKRILFGMLISCIDSCALTLTLVHILRIPVGPLTANLSTVVFVMTLSHIVFLTFNWKELRTPDETTPSPLPLPVRQVGSPPSGSTRLKLSVDNFNLRSPRCRANCQNQSSRGTRRGRGEGEGDKSEVSLGVLKLDEGRGLVRDAIKLTFNASLWSMMTTLLGFLSLLFVQATPLRQLGISGAIGTVVAFAAAFMIYPRYLPERINSGDRAKVSRAKLMSRVNNFFQRKHSLIVTCFILSIFPVLIGLFKVNTDPNLISYFKDGTELREGLEYIDQNGGSSPLKIMVAGKDKQKFNSGEAHGRLWQLHEALEKGPLVGNAVSLPIVLAEARTSPLARFLSTEWILKLMESPRFGEVAQYFITEDRMKTLFLLRMKEVGRKTSRSEVVEALKQIVEDQGFIPVFVGGVFLLQGKLSELLTKSLVSGLTLLIFMFVVMGWLLSRSLNLSIAMLLSLIVIPVMMLGIIGHLRIPLDVISAPAANLAVAMGVDSMIHMLFFTRRYAQEEGRAWSVWAKACIGLWQPILCSMFIVGAGFSIFMLSTFPPTERFGFSVVLGSFISLFSALFLLPTFATAHLKHRRGIQRRTVQVSSAIARRRNADEAISMRPSVAESN